MSRGRKPEDRLNERQRRLVADNIGLVAVHLRRNVHGLAVSRRDREWDDLFQEGCVGLMRAALAYREDRGIPFAAFALPRIHNAVSVALQNKFSTVHVPAKQHPDRPKVYSLSGEIEGLKSRPRRDPGDSNDETVGERLRGKYERAVRAACHAVLRTGSTRGDRDELVRILAEERFLVPHTESRRPLRQIARDTRSSYARVAQCDRQLGKAVRQTLESDPEFHELTRRARADPRGCDSLIDEELEDRLAGASADEFARRFRRSDPRQRACMLDALLHLSGRPIEDMARAGVLKLSTRDRERLLWERQHAR